MTNGVLYGEYEMSVWPALLGIAGELALILLFVVGLTMAVRLVWQAGQKKPKAEKTADAYNIIEEIDNKDMDINEVAETGDSAVNLAAVLRQHRKRCGMTQELVAEQLGVSRQAVSRWEQGLARPSTANIKRLAELFGVSAAELLREAQK